MKKITFLFAALGLGLTVQAQQLQAESNAPFSGTSSTENSQAIIWEQPSIGGSGIISDFSSIDEVGVFSADDFNLAVDTRIDEISVYGFQNLGNLTQIMNGFDIYIYANDPQSNSPMGDPSQPGTGVAEFPNISVLPIPGYPITITEVDGYEIYIDMFAANGDADFVLPAGDYWLVAAPRIDVTPVSDGDQRWNWFDAGVPGNGVNEAHLIDPSDVFGLGATVWTTFTDLGVTFGSTAFVILGEPDSLGVNDNISDLASVYPNPTTGVLNVDMPSTVTVKGSNLYNLLGQDTGMKLVDGTMNISELARGVYILNVETSAGTLTQKVVKN